MAVLEATSDVVTTGQLFSGVFGEDEVPADLPAVIGVCSGEWRREPDGRWRFWADSND